MTHHRDSSLMSVRTRRLLPLLAGALALAVPRPASANYPVYDHGLVAFSPVSPCRGLNPHRFGACPPGYRLSQVLAANWYATTNPAVIEVLVRCVGIHEPYLGLEEIHIDRSTYEVTGPLIASVTPSEVTLGFGQSASVTLQLTCTVETEPFYPEFTGIRIPFTNSEPSALAAPGAVIVAPATNSVSFLVTGKLVDVPTLAKLSITLFGQTIGVTVTVQPPTLEGLIATTQANVITLVQQGALTSGQGSALNAKLQAALDKLAGGQTHVAVNQVQAFVNQVQDLVSTGVLTPSQAHALIEAAESLMRRLGG